MRLGSTLLALALSALMGSAGRAQSDEPAPVDQAKAKAKTGVKPSAAGKPAAKRRTPRASSARSIRMQQAQAAAVRNANNAFIFPPTWDDPLGLAAGANGLPLGIVADGSGFGGVPFGIVSGGGYVDPQFGTAFGNAIRTRDFTGVIPDRGQGPTATGGLSGPTDKRLIRGFDGDGNGDLPASPGDITHARVDRVKGGNHIAGYGVPLRKGELVYRGNYIPGQGVIGQSTDETQGGTYRPGFGVVGGGSATGFGAIAEPSYYGASSLPSNNFGGNGNAGFYGGPGLLNNNYGANGNAGFYGGSGLPNNNYGGNGNAGFYGASSVLNGNNYGGNGNAGFYGGSSLLNSNNAGPVRPAGVAGGTVGAAPNRLK